MKNAHIITKPLDFNIVYLACENGFTGINCVTKCPYPSYGRDCQSLCDCIATFCDYANGCIQASGSKIPYQYYPLSSIWHLISNDNTIKLRIL